MRPCTVYGVCVRWQRHTAHSHRPLSSTHQLTKYVYMENVPYVVTRRFIKHRRLITIPHPFTFECCEWKHFLSNGLCDMCVCRTQLRSSLFSQANEIVNFSFFVYACLCLCEWFQCLIIMYINYYRSPSHFGTDEKWKWISAHGMHIVAAPK